MVAWRPAKPRRGGATGAGATVVVALALAVLCAGPTSGSSVPGVVRLAPFAGAVVPTSGASWTGCGQVHYAPRWGLDLRSGHGGAGSSGRSVVCGRPSRVGATTSAASAAGGVDLALAVPVRAAATHVRLRVNWSLQLNLSARDGFGGSSVPACSAPLTTYRYYVADYGWNYTYNAAYGFYYFAQDNDTMSYQTNQPGSYNDTSGTGPPPVPFQLNATSYESIILEYGAAAECNASASALISSAAYLVDTSTGLPQPETLDTVGRSGSLVQATVRVLNETDWYCYASTYWYGPSNVSDVTPLACYSSNATLTSFVSGTTSGSGPTIGSNNSASWSSTVSGSGVIAWNSSFVPAQRYVLYLNLTGSFTAFDSWRHGSASWSLAFDRRGYGFTVESLAVT